MCGREDLTVTYTLCRLASMGRDIRITGPLLKVLQEFLNRPTGRLSGADIALSTRLASGTLYPLLKRLEDAKWLVSEWEDVSPHEVGRPRRRLYEMTGLGANQAKGAIRETFPHTEVLSWQY
jgi:PadR family transcriptional regulator, regulatory protein PadR